MLAMMELPVSTVCHRHCCSTFAAGKDNAMVRLAMSGVC